MPPDLLLTLPAELLHQIIADLDGPSLITVLRASPLLWDFAAPRLYRYLDISGARLRDLLAVYAPQPPPNAYALQLYKWHLATRYYLPIHEHQRRALSLVRSLNIRNISRPALEALYAAAAGTTGVPLFPNVEKVHVYGTADAERLEVIPGPRDQGVLPAPEDVVLFPSTAHLCAWWTRSDGTTAYPPNDELFPTQPPQSVTFHQVRLSNTTEICPFVARPSVAPQTIYLLEDYGQAAEAEDEGDPEPCTVCGGTTDFNARHFGGTQFTQAW